ILNRALTYASTARCAEAMPDFARVVELNPKESRAYLERGSCHETLGRDDLALADYSAHLQMEPSSFSGFERRAAVEFRMRQYDAALADYVQALAIVPDSTRALYGQGVVKKMKGDVRGGDNDIAMATALRPAIAGEMAARGVKP